MLQGFSPRLIFLTLIFCAACQPVLSLQSESPQARLRERAQELKNSLVVLAVCLQPGDEDFETLADLRVRRGARIVSAYVTNGESGASDLDAEYAHDLAALRRREASEALTPIGGGVFFLNVPDIGVATDTGSVLAAWDADTLRERFMKLMSITKPHLVVFFPERFRQKPSLQWSIAQRYLLDAVDRLRPPMALADLSRLRGIGPWQVERIVTTRKLIRGSILERAVRRMSAEARGKYVSLSRQFNLYGPHGPYRYERILFPASRQTKYLDEGLPSQVSRALSGLKSRIVKAADKILRIGPKSNRAALLEEVTALLDSVDFRIASVYRTLGPSEQKVLLLWKDGLEEVKNELLGVSVSYSLSEPILTFLQVTSLRIDSIRGMSPQGRLFFFFPAVKDGWIINESKKDRIPFEIGSEFRLVSPPEVRFNLPAAFEGLEQSNTVTPITCFVVYSHEKRTNSFVAKVELPFQFAPRFTTEILIPIVRAQNGENVVVRFTNHSRDGVADEFGVSDSLVVSSRKRFRLSEKEAVWVDTLELAWAQDIREGSYVIPLDIAGSHVANFVARVFDSRCDKTKRVGLITTFPRSATAKTLKSLGVSYERRSPGEISQAWLFSRDVILIDERLMGIDTQIVSWREGLTEFVEKGGHLIVLTQEAAAWNRQPLFKGMKLQPTDRLVASTPVHMDTAHGFLSIPNKITESDWDGWLWYRGYNQIELSGQAEVPLSAQSGQLPLLVTKRLGRGRVSYVDLALPHQWMNIHGGAFRLLANILSH